MKKKIIKHLTLFFIGGGVYQLIEFLWKTLRTGGTLHWSMFLLGGICFLIIGAINEYFTWDLSLWKQAILGTTFITIIEFIFGIVINIYLKLNIWNYSNLPLNILGQICLPFMIVWFFLSIVAIIVDDILRWKLFNEEKPKYKLI